MFPKVRLEPMSLPFLMDVLCLTFLVLLLVDVGYLGWRLLLLFDDGSGLSFMLTTSALACDVDEDWLLLLMLLLSLLFGDAC